MKFLRQKKNTPVRTEASVKPQMINNSNYLSVQTNSQKMCAKNESAYKMHPVCKCLNN